MTRDQIRDLVVKALGDIAPELDPSTLGPDTRLREELDLDSMDFLNFALALHDALGIDIPETDYPKMATLAQCVEYLASRLGASGSSPAG
jgi:acyl carrier protein